MPESYVQGAFTFSCTAAEAALLHEGWEIASDLTVDAQAPEPSAALLAMLPPVQGGNPFSGLTSLFCDLDNPDFGAVLEIVGDPRRSDRSIVTFHGLSDLQPEPLADFIRICCQDTLKQAPIGFTWGFGGDRPILDSFGGGWAAIFPDRIDFGSTSRALAESLKAATADRNMLDMWAEIPGHPVTDWQAEVANCDTRRGYHDWVQARKEAAATEAENARPASLPRRIPKLAIRHVPYAGGD